MKSALFSPNPKLLLMPVETKSRELQAKVFFASRAAQRGFEVWIGSARELFQNIEEFPRGVFMAHHVGKGMRPNLPRARHAGMGIVAWDEEALVVKNDGFYVEERVVEANLRLCHRFFTRGQGDRDALFARFPDLTDRIFATGNPRVDILNEQFIALHEDPAVQTDRKRVMINSRFSHSNPAHTTAEHFRNSQLKRFRHNATAHSFKQGYMDYTDRLFQAFVSMVSAVAQALPDFEVIVRPHPSEDEAVWLRLAEGARNVRVTKQSTATAWSLSSDVTIHNGCTTAVETALLGCHVLAFCPLRSEDYDIHLPNKVSERIESVETLVARIRELSKPTAEARAANARRAREHLSGVIAGMDGNALASDLVLDVLERDTNYPARMPGDFAICGVKRASIMFQRAMMRWGLNPREWERQRKKDDYFKVKFSGLDIPEIEDILRRIGSQHLRIEKVRKDWVRLLSSEVGEETLL